MKKTVFTIITAALFTATFTETAEAGWTHAKDQTVSVTTIPVQLKRGALVEYGRLVFTANVHAVVTQTGHTAKWLKGYASDTRECHWNMSAEMKMQYFVSSITGKQDSQPAQTIVLPIQINGASNGRASIFDHDPCSDYTTEQDAAISSIKQQILARFDGRVEDGIAKFRQQMIGISIVINPS